MMIVDEYTCMEWKLAMGLNVQGAFHGDSILQGLTHRTEHRHYIYG